MNRDLALAISEDLQVAMISHTIEFGYHDRLAQPEQWNVVVVALTLWPSDFDKLQEIGRKHGRGLAWTLQRFVFVEERGE